MKTWIAIAMLAALGCGGGDTLDTESTLQIGTAKQALTYLDGYGQMLNSLRCWTNNHQIKWVGACVLPSPLRKVWYHLLPSTCTGTYAADYAAAMTTAGSYMVGQLRNAGWSADTDQTSLTPPFLEAQVKCGSPFPGEDPHAQASTNLPYTPILDCTTQQDGQRCVYSSAETRAHQSRIETGQFTAAVSAKRRVLLFDILAHEMGHAAGLGHEDGTPNGEANCLAPGLPVPGGSQLLDPGGCQSGLTAQQWFNAHLTSFELDMLAAYH